MLTINKTLEDNLLTLEVIGRLDTTNSPKLMEEFNASSEDVSEVVVDLEHMDYLSSAGLRVLLSMQKIMNKQGKMTIVNVSPDAMEIFDMTGFTNLLNIR